MLKITKLTTEYRENPLGISTPNPRFTWQFAKESDEKQKAYSVTVKCGNETVWATGKVKSAQSVNIEYKGKPVVSAGMYDVEVNVYGEDGDVATANGTFEMGLLKESDWTGEWCGSNANFTSTSTIARRIFKLEDKEIKRARMYLIGLGYHELFINEQKVCDEFLAPSNADHTRSVYYKTYDITPFLKQGVENSLAIELGFGWFGKKTFLFQSFVEYADGTFFNMHSALDGMLWVGGGAVTRTSVFGGETQDNVLAEKLGNWKAVDYTPDWDKGWMYAFHQIPEIGVKRSDIIDPIRSTEEFKPLSVTKIGNDFVYDFGQNMAGFVKLVAKGEKGAKVSMRFAEVLKPDGNIEQLNLRTATQLDELILNGDGEETFVPKFTYHGFRYMQIAIEGKAEVVSAIAHHVHNDVKKTGHFECSDEILNALHKNVLYTELNNLHSIMTDCPQRDERIGWLNDLSSRIFQNINNFDLSRMLPKLLQDFADTQDSEGTIADTAPNFAGARPADPICASYILFGIKAYQYYGDKQTLAERYDGFKAWIDYLVTRCTPDLSLPLSYYGDWVVPDIYVPTKVDGEFISSAYLYWQFNLMAYIARLLGKKKDVKYFEKLAVKCKDTFNKKWFDAEKISYHNDSQTANIIPVSLGLCAPEHREPLIKRVISDCIQKGKHNTSGNQGYRHFFYQLAEAGETQLLIDVLKNKEYPGWGNMLDRGATTIWERWEEEIKLEMHSFDHPMFASFDGIFYHYLGGIKIDEDACACDKITIKPHANNEINYVNCSLDTVRGTIVSNWKKVGDRKVVLNLEIPHSTTATLDFTGTINGAAFEQGKKLTGGSYTIEFIV